VLWSSWGDIAVAPGSDGRVYMGIGDHGRDTAGVSHALIYRYDPGDKTLKKLVDINPLTPRWPGEPTWSKVHAGIAAGNDGLIYFTPTLNDGGRAGEMKWTSNLAGGQFFAFNPKTDETKLVATFPGEVTATSLYDPQRQRYYFCFERTRDGAALGAVDLKTGKVLRLSKDGAIVADRALALDQKGRLYFNGAGGELFRYDPADESVSATGMVFAKETPGSGGKETSGGPTMRSSATVTRDGWVYGATMNPGRLFRFHGERKKLDMLGPDFLDGSYTVVTALSPDERFLYYLPGAHGHAKDHGTPVVQYELATGKRKVLAFLREPIERKHGVILSGSYGVKLSADGGTLYANLNGDARDDLRPETDKLDGFGLTSFVAMEIPEEER
jgi:outer membrane protein assembly factor BamB